MSGMNSCDKIIFHHCKDFKGLQKGHRSAPRICQNLHKNLQNAHDRLWCSKCAADTDPASQGRVLLWRPAIPTRLENLQHFTHTSVPPLLPFLAVLPFVSLCRRNHFCKKPFFQTAGSFPETQMLNTSHSSEHFIPNKGTQGSSCRGKNAIFIRSSFFPRGWQVKLGEEKRQDGNNSSLHKPKHLLWLQEGCNMLTFPLAGEKAHTVELCNLYKICWSP